MYLHREIAAVVGLVRVTVPTTSYQLHMCHMEHLTQFQLEFVEWDLELMISASECLSFIVVLYSLFHMLAGPLDW